MEATQFGRRHVLKTLSSGFGYLAFSALASTQARAREANPLAPRPPHFEPRAKRVIFLFMQGGPSHVDTFDHKPRLEADDGKASGRGGRKLLKSPWKFEPRGASGLWISELFPHVARHADDLCLLNSLQTDLPNHPQATVQMHTGSFQFVRPSMGAWILYGLGTENEELPGFIAINPPGRIGGAQSYGCAFLPAAFQGTPLAAGGRGGQEPIANLSSPLSGRGAQRRQLDLLEAIHRERLAVDVVNPELEGIIESYELAFRMQSAVPRLMDLQGESPRTLERYGIGARPTDAFGRQCLLARRFAEAGVRFIELSMGGWDQHQNLRARLAANCASIDQPIAALLSDLKDRGLLEETLVVWGGEFGRTPAAQNPDGRDHNSRGFSMWAAGGGVKGGIAHGATDEHGEPAVVDPLHIHDLHATILHLLGLDHERLTYRYSGRDFRLTDVHGKVAHGIIA